MELVAKRPLDELTEEEAFKRRKLETAVIIPKGVERTSDLPSPIILLTGHEAEVYTMKFSPDGKSMASAGVDKRIFLWNVFGDCSNYAVLKGHTNAILELHWSHEGDSMFTCSADKTLQVWDVETLSRRKKIKAHETVVNTCCPARRNGTIVASGADDCTTKIWDLRAPRRPSTVLTGKYPITSVQFSDQNDQIFVSDTSGVVNAFDLKRNSVAYQLTGHTDIITGSKLSPNGQYLLTNSMDNIVRAWDVRPFVQGGEQRRCIKVFGGHMHNVEKNLLKCNWSPDGKYVAAGSGDQPTHVYIWDFETRKVEYKLPGHSATVNEVDFHPTQPIVGSCGSDKCIYIGELAKNPL